MSLHIGRLSPDVRQPYLEHLFKKYGHCVVYLKDGYGFAVYDSSADAARALHALHGKYVCGGHITVNWSKHQPRFSQGFRRSSRFDESSHRRTSRDGRENIKLRDSPVSHDEYHDKNHPASHDESHGKNPPENHDAGSAREKQYDNLAEDVNKAGVNIAEEEASLGDVKRDEGGTVDASAIEHERWAEAGKGTLGDGDGFDYEPYHGLNRQKETGDVIKASTRDSHGHVRSSEKWLERSDKRVKRSHEHDDTSRSPTCYTCGVSGHTARHCPQEMDTKFKARRDGLNFRERLELRQKRFGSPSRRRPEFHVRPMDQKHHRVQDGRKPFSDVKKRVHKSSNVHRESRRHDQNSENMREATKETHKRSRSERSHGPSLSSEPSKHSRRDNIRGSHSNWTSSDSRSRSPHSRSHFRAHSPPCSAHSSSKSSQPTQREGSRSNTNHLVPFSTSAPPQGKSSPDVENTNPDGLMKSHLDKSLADHNDNIGSGVHSQNANFDGTPSMMSTQDILKKNARSKSLKLTTNEVISALKRSRMEKHGLDSSDQPVEKYFGAARLWPWEIIYYRRLKKGPITTENYAKRLEQNKEFDIVDRYVRSSSGWWEYH